MTYLFLLIPIAFTLLQLKMNKYIFSPLVTLSCAAIALMNSPIMFIALFVSCIGDYFMAHKGSREWMYLLGIAGFFAAHVVFIVHALLRAVDPKAGLFTGALLALWYTPYLLMRVISKVPKTAEASRSSVHLHQHRRSRLRGNDPQRTVFHRHRHAAVFGYHDR